MFCTSMLHNEHELFGIDFICVHVTSVCPLFRPVSAYALFFRDTQAAIKSHNPSASFGEMSKIVAAMWDSLDDIHKNV